MPTLTMDQIIGYAKGAGLSGDALVIAGAVGMAESSGRTDVVNFLGCTGIWQIYVKVHRAAIVAKFPGQDPTTAMKDPAKNAQMMMHISGNGKNWRPWEAYTNGSYLRYMAAAKAAAGAPATGAPGGGMPTVNVGLPNPIDGISSFASAISNRDNWLRVLYVIAGIALIGVALARLTNVDNAVSAVAGKAAKVAITKKAA